MELELRKIAPYAAAFAIGYKAGRATIDWIERTLRTIDEALVDFDFDDCEADAGHIHTVAGAVLHNTYGLLLPLAADFCYRASDPLAVAVQFSVDIELPSGEMVSDSATWEFARALLADALDAPEEVVGEGDVRASYQAAPDVLTLWLVEANGDARRVDLDAAPVRDFLRETYRLATDDGDLVPQVDDAISRLLNGTWKQ